MKVQPPSPAATVGLCAAFFFGAAVRIANYFLARPAAWERGHYSPSLSAQIFTVGIFVVAGGCAWMGFQLLYQRRHAILHALVLGSLLLAASAINLFFVIQIAQTGQMPAKAIPGAFFSALVAVLFSGVVLGLLGWLRRSGHDSAEP